jgi:antirestriction protein ArdC
MKNESTNTNRQDVYSRITAQIVAELEKGVRPWVKPWNAEHAAGRIGNKIKIGRRGVRARTAADDIRRRLFPAEHAAG